MGTEEEICSTTTTTTTTTTTPTPISACSLNIITVANYHCSTVPLAKCELRAKKRIDGSVSKCIVTDGKCKMSTEEEICWTTTTTTTPTPITATTTTPTPISACSLNIIT